jgi:hypothetical protein
VTAISSTRRCSKPSGRRDCVYDRDFAAQLAKIFADDLAACRRVTLEEWRGRGAMVKLREMIASLLRDQV